MSKLLRFHKILFSILLIIASSSSYGQDTAIVTNVIPITPDSIKVYHPDSSLRILNLNPFVTLHVDSSLSYQLLINKSPDNYFWYLKNSPIGLRINKDNGLLSFRAEKSYFLSGKLKYDYNYKVILGVQNMADPAERIDTAFTIVFYSTEIVPSRVKPAISSTSVGR